MAEQGDIRLAELTVQDLSGKGAKQTLKVYRSAEGLIYTRFPDGTMEAGAPSLQVKRGSYLSYTYNPAETVYTGASSGNIHMGGFHTREAGYTERQVSSDRGYIRLCTRCDRFLLTRVRIPGEIQNRFRRDSEFETLVSGGEIACLGTDRAGQEIRSAMTGREGTYETIQLLSIAQDRKHLDYDHCQRIARLLKRILEGKFPPTIDELYARADALSRKKDAAGLQQAMEIFRSISHYRDAAARANALKGEVAQAQEREELQADRNRDRGKRALILAVLFGFLLLAVAAAILS